MNKITATAGPAFLGYSFHFILYGALCIQAYLYYLSFPKDTILAQSLVSLLLVAGTAQTIINIHDAFATYSAGFASQVALADPRLSWLSVPIMSGIISAGVQIFFSYRIWLLCRSHVIVMVTSVIAVFQCVAAVVAGTMASRGTFNASELHKSVTPTSIWLSGSASCDLVITITMVYHFIKRKDKRSLNNAILAVAVSLLLETGAITAIIATVDVVLFLAYPNQVYHLAVAPMLAMLYSNSCLAVLNSRINIIGGREEASFAETSISSTVMARHTNAGLTRRFVDVVPAAPTAPAVQIQQEVWSEGIALTTIKQTSSLDTSEFGSKPKNITG